MNHKTRLLLVAALFVLVLPLVFTGNASAKYLSDGAVQSVTTGQWEVADPGQCYVRDAVTIPGTYTGTIVTVTPAVGQTLRDACRAQISAVTISADCTATDSTHTSPAWKGRFSSGVCTGNVVYNNNYPVSREGCLHCHNGTGVSLAATKTSYLMTGHKNMLRKVTAGQPWQGPGSDGLLHTYTTDGTNAIDFMSASDPYAKITVGGVDQNLYYIYGNWMAAAPSVVYGTTGYNGAVGATNGYSCAACHTTGYSDNTNPGVLNRAAGSGLEPEATYPGIVLNAATPKWDQNGIQCSRCHGSVSDTGVAGTSSHHVSFTGASINNLCYGCHQSNAKLWPAQGGAAGGTTQAEPNIDPTLIPTGANHGADNAREFNGHVLGNSFLNSVHAKFTGTVTLNSLGKYNIAGGTYASTFEGGQGSCTTCHDVHNSLFVEGQNGIKEECVGCHTDPVKAPTAPQYNDATMAHPRGAGTPFDTARYADACSVCHMAIQAKDNGDQVSMPVHVWRINTSAAYNTFPTADQWNGTNGATKDRNAQTSPDGPYTNAVWVDLDLACGQCHQGANGGSIGLQAAGKCVVAGTVNPAITTSAACTTAGGSWTAAPSFTKAELAAAAAALHDGGNTTGCLDCHSSAQGTYRAVQQGVNHHNGSCTTCHTTQHRAVPVMPVPNYTLIAKSGKVAIDTSIQVSCLTCHSVDVVRSSDGATLKAIVPSTTYGPVDNHHNGHAYIPGQSGTDPGLYCLGCHGSASVVLPQVGSTYAITASGLPTATVSVMKGLSPNADAGNTDATSTLCVQCHSNVDSGHGSFKQYGAGKNHHAGKCVTCHHADGGWSGAYGAGTTYVPPGEVNGDCQHCHASATTRNIDGATLRAVNQGVDHHNGTCTECHGELGGVEAMPAITDTADSIINACLTCHKYDQAGGTVPAIHPKLNTYGGINDESGNQADNHHRGHSGAPSGTDPKLYCLGCHGSATGLTITSSGLSTTVVSAMKGYTGGADATSSLCLGCHSTVIQSGATKNHHAGACLNCHVNAAVPGGAGATNQCINGTPNALCSTTAGVGGNVSYKPGDVASWADCSACHDTTGTNPNGPSASHHVVGTGVSCEECHAAAGVRPTVPALNPASRDSVTAYCQTCHASAQGTVRALVVSGAGDNHHRGSGTSTARSVAGCLYCHGSGGGMPFGGADTEAKQDATAKGLPSACQACHHAVVESGATQDHHAGDCLTCHLDSKVPFPGKTDSINEAVANSRDSVTNYCEACHSAALTRSADNSAIRAIIPSGSGDNHHRGSGTSTARSVAGCLYCHGNTGGLPFGNANSENMQDAVAPNTCNASCHATTLPTSGQHHTGAGLALTNNTTCLTCHSQAAGAMHPGVAGIPAAWADCTACHSSGGVDPLPADHHTVAGTCEDCHQNAGVKPTEVVLTLQTNSRDSVTNYCLQCHSTVRGTKHAIVPSGTGDNHHRGSGTSTARSVAGCLYCHGVGKAFGDASTEVMVDQVATGSCSGSCHATAQAASGTHHTGEGVTPVNSFLCLACHVAGDATTEQPGVAVLPAAWEDCTACHTMTLKWPMNSQCSDCHTSAGVKPATSSVCLPCHSGTGPGKTMTPAQLSASMIDIHSANPRPVADFSYSFGPGNSQIMNVTATATCSDGACGYSWDFNGEHTGSGVSTSYTFAAGGSKTVVLTVTDTGNLTTTQVSKTVNVQTYDVPPTAAATLNSCSNWVASVTNTSSDDHTGFNSTILWGDGLASSVSATGTVTHTYTKASTSPYPISIRVVDSIGQTVTASVGTCSAANYTVSGVTRNVGGTIMGGVGLVLRNFNTTQSCTTSPAISLATSNATTGAYSFGNLKSGNRYGICASKAGKTFANPVFNAVVTGNVIQGINSTN